jgi:CheY-like chemotaxis protein
VNPSLASVKSNRRKRIREQMLRVLVVDDFDDSVEISAELLKVLGHDPLRAMDGPSAVTLARKHRPDVVLMDLWMPRMNGCEATRALKESRATRSIPVIALTGDGTDTMRRSALEAGCAEVLLKPVDAEILQEAFARVVRRRPRQV